MKEYADVFKKLMIRHYHLQYLGLSLALPLGEYNIYLDQGRCIKSIVGRFY